MKGKIFLAAIALLGLSACAEKDDKNNLKERARLEEEGQQQKVQERARKMEADLADRHYFYNAFEGEYLGSLTVGNQEYRIRFTFARSLPPYTGDRVRELSEIENDLNNLFFHMQVVQWHPADTSTAVGCRVTGIRPNMEEGQVVIASNDCPNLYTVMISEGGAQAFTQKEQKAQGLAARIKNKELSEVTSLIGYVQPSSVSARYAFTVTRVQ